MTANSSVISCGCFSNSIRTSSRNSSIPTPPKSCRWRIVCSLRSRSIRKRVRRAWRSCCRNSTAPPGAEEVLRLAQFPGEAGVGDALKALLAKPATRVSHARCAARHPHPARCREAHAHARRGRRRLAGRRRRRPGTRYAARRFLQSRGDGTKADRHRGKRIRRARRSRRGAAGARFLREQAQRTLRETRGDSVGHAFAR